MSINLTNRIEDIVEIICLYIVAPLGVIGVIYSSYKLVTSISLYMSINHIQTGTVLLGYFKIVVSFKIACIFTYIWKYDRIQEIIDEKE